MAKAILSDNKTLFAHYDVLITGRSLESTKKFISANKLKATALDSSSKLNVKNAKPSIDIANKHILLCTKPKGIDSFCFKGKAEIVYSVLAGSSIATLESSMQAHIFVRIMPNIAAVAKASASAFYCHSKNAISKAKLSEIERFITSFGTAIAVQSEELIESSIATSGSSIAFLALVAEALIEAGILEGLSHAQSEALVRGMFEGFAKVFATKSPQELKYAISSPGGTTIRGLAVLEKYALKSALIEAAHTAVAHAKSAIESSKKAK